MAGDRVIRVARCAAAMAALLALPASASASAGASPGAAVATPANPCAAAPVTTPLVASANRLGVVDLSFFYAQRAPVDFYECVGDRALLVGRRTGPSIITSLWAATSWRCGRLARHFAATATLPDGTLARGTGSIRTRSCAQRFALRLPQRVARGRVAHLQIADRWHVGGVRTKLCVTPPGGQAACRRLDFTGGVNRATRDLRLDRRGLWRVELRVAGHTTRDSIAVGVRRATRKAPPPKLLATGDSTMDGVDSFLADQLGSAATVVSDVHPGIAISRADAWQPLAIKQVAKVKPATTVVSIGANEGWPMRGADRAQHECCDPAWVDELARRMRRTMVTYGRRVFWLTIPGPRNAQRVAVVAAVNAAIQRAAQGLAGVHVVRLDLLFTPDGYRDAMPYRGRDVRVREPDGIHLNVAGAEIAARAVVDAIRAAG